jgi:hypothetical protein
VLVIKVPLVLAAIAAGRYTIRVSRDRGAGGLDPPGAALSLASLGGLLYAVTEVPERGWTDPAVAACFVLGAVGAATFVGWERRAEQPMLDVGFFRDPRFSAAIVSIMALFFGMFGLMFVSTQVLQSVLGYDTFGAGLRLVPLPLMVVVFAQVSVRAASRVGTRAVVTAGLVIVTSGLAVGSTIETGSGYGVLAIALTLTGIGVGCTLAPAVGSLMSSVPPTRAAVASAVNDTARLSAAAIGVAVVGSIVSSTYRASVRDAAALLTPDQLGHASTSITNAVSVAGQLEGSAGTEVLAIARQGFVDGVGGGLLVAAIVSAFGALVAWRFLPADSHRRGPFDPDALVAPRHPDPTRTTSGASRVN